MGHLFLVCCAEKSVEMLQTVINRILISDLLVPSRKKYLIRGWYE